MVENQGPRVFWTKPEQMNSMFKRRRLFAAPAGSRCFRETPYFLDTATRLVSAQWGKHMLYGSGMAPSGGAALLCAGPRIDAVKHRAEQRAFADMQET